MILQEVFAPVNEVKPLSKDQMEAMDKAREQDDFVLPELEKPEPGFFDGMGEASWKGVASSALKSASALDTALSSTGMVRAALNNAQIETGYTFDDLDKRQSEIENRLDQDSKELRRRARDDFGVDPTTMGTAAQIIYGVAEAIPKAIGYSLLAGPAGGSVLFGADLGISRSQELMDEGVDKNTAINAGLVTFGTAALGMRLPATFGRSRIASATIGAAANAGLTAAEMQGVNWVLQNQNYKELSQKYQINGIDLATSAIFGGVMGGVLWRPGMNLSRPQTAKERSVPLQERIKRQLREASPDTISDEAIETQAVVQATGIQVMADRAQIDADAIAPEIVRGETGTTDFNQPVTQGRQWHMGSHVIGRENEDVNVVHSRFIGESDRQKAIDNLEIALKNGVENRDTGWALTGSRSDAKKTLPPIKFRKDEPGLYDSIVEQLDEIVFHAKLVESHRDVKHGNPDVQGIHIFAVPFDFNNKNYRVQLTVRDYVGGGSQARLATHSIDSIEVLPMGESDDGIGAKAPRAPTATSPNQSETLSSPGAGLSRTWSSSDTVTLSKLLPGYKRADGKSPFDPEDSSSYSERGVYFDSQSYVKNPLLTVHNISQDNLLKANQLGGLAVPSLGITRADSAYSDFGDITLIGTRGMADPANGTPVFSMDAYTNRFPEARWEKSVNRDNARAFMREYSTWEEKFGVDDGSVSYYLEREPNRDRFLREFANSPVTKQAFLETKGVTVEPEYIVPRNQTGLVKELEADFRAILDDVDDIENYQKRFSEAYADAVDRLGDNVPAFLKRRADKVRQGEVLSWDFLNPYVRAMEQPLNEAAPRIDRIATENKINAEVDKYQSEYADWVQSKTKDLFGEPTIRVGNRDLPMTLENVVLAMTRRSARNTERTLTFGPGNVRAAASKRFRSLSDIQRNRDRITDTDTVNSINKEIDDLLADFRNSVVDYYKWGGSFEKFDDAMRALADTAKGNPTKDKLRTALNKNGFNASEVPDKVLETGVNALVQLRRGMTDYFEAKPQRAVHFDEFVGAAVPENVSPEVVSILENNGIRVERYGADNRSEVVNRLSRQLNQERGDVLYQRAWHGSPHIFDAFSTEHIGTGEGAQAHGWGLYFAADRGVAERYKNVLTDRSASINSVLDELVSSEVDVFSRYIDLDDYETFSREIERGAFSPKTNELLRALEENDWLGYDSPVRAIRQALSPSLSNYEHTPRLDRAVEAFDGEGRVFEVEIPDENSMLDEQKYMGSSKNTELRGKIEFILQEWDYNNPGNPLSLPESPNGREIYQAISDALGGPKEASLYLKRFGIKGITYEGRRDGRCYVVFDDKAIQTIEYFQRQMQEGAGAVRGSFDPARNRITLTANANISTYSHEMGHWYLENLFQLSRRAVAENTLKEDANILLKEFGIKSVDDWDNLGVDGQRKYQEQFASWVEIYLSEGRAPKPTLQRVFERLGQWLVDLYRELGGVKKAVGDTYKAEVGEELPPVSEEVAKVLDRLFANDRAVRKASRVSKSQVAAARMVQANRTNNNKLEEIVAMPNGKEKTRALRDLEKSTKAQLKAIQAMKRGLPVDVSQDVEQMNVDVDHLFEMKGNFGRAYVMGNTDSAVVLQNRDRSDVGSIGQMNAIAANPQYGLVSVSRSYSGAPVVSYGAVPDSAHLGNNDFIVETNGNRVPFMYAVVEAGNVETSNFIDGSTNAGYGNPQRMNAVVGNGRMTALKEAYNRGTANQYRADLEADTAHGIKPEVIQKMKNPVLVRVINPEDVTTGFISRSNGQQVLALDDVEVAREDAPKIRARAGQYEFDEAGNPTNDTLALFIQDLHDPNALGRLITSDGRPTPEAVRRIRNAVFFEAYQSPELSALFSQEVDPGIRRILNGLANVAPRIIELREQAQELDFSNLLVEAANRIRQARLNPDEGVDFASQMSFLDNPATSAFVEFLDDNANSAAAIARTLNPLIDWAENAARAADGGLFGGDAEVHVDLADVVGQLRNIINDQRAGAGLEPLPEIDVIALRDQIQTTVDTVARAVDEVNAHIEAETQQAEMDIANEAQALDAQRQQSLAVLNEKSSVDARAQLMMEQNPDQVYRVLDENGMEVQGTLNDLLAQADDEVRQAEIEAAGIGRAVECVLRNGGI